MNFIKYEKEKTMKKFLFAALMLLIVNGAMAQDIRIGIKSGGNSSTLACNPVPNATDII
jgi:hypothetical protein